MDDTPLTPSADENSAGLSTFIRLRPRASGQASAQLDVDALDAHLARRGLSAQQREHWLRRLIKALKQLVLSLFGARALALDGRDDPSVTTEADAPPKIEGEQTAVQRVAGLMEQALQAALHPIDLAAQTASAVPAGPAQQKLLARLAVDHAAAAAAQLDEAIAQALPLIEAGLPNIRQRSSALQHLGVEEYIQALASGVPTLREALARHDPSLAQLADQVHAARARWPGVLQALQINIQMARETAGLSPKELADLLAAHGLQLGETPGDRPAAPPVAPPSATPGNPAVPPARIVVPLRQEDLPDGTYLRETLAVCERFGVTEALLRERHGERFRIVPPDDPTPDPVESVPDNVVPLRPRDGPAG